MCIFFFFFEARLVIFLNSFSEFGLALILFSVESIIRKGRRPRAVFFFFFVCCFFFFLWFASFVKVLFNLLSFTSYVFVYLINVVAGAQLSLGLISFGGLSACAHRL